MCRTLYKDKAKDKSLALRAWRRAENQNKAKQPNKYALLMKPQATQNTTRTRRKRGSEIDRE